jgi:GNAT superfamily N-acetyltransferase
MTLVMTSVGPAETVTRLGPTDKADIVAMHDRCSPQTRYARWHGHTNVFPRAYLASVTAGDDEHLAVGAWRDGRLIGLASAAIAAPGTREIGILVEDEWQHRGVGGQLLAALVSDARGSGTHRLRAEVLSEDIGLLAPLATLGPMTTTTSHGVVTAEVTIRA